MAERVTETCELCHETPALDADHGLRVCQGCHDAADYLRSLTPEEWAADQAAIAAYVDGGEHL